MAGRLRHSPARVVATALAEAGVVSPRSGGAPWPVHVWKRPEGPDDIVVVYDTQGRDGGNSQPDGVDNGLPGVMVMVRSKDPEVGYDKADEIKYTLDQVILRQTVVLGESTYCLGSVDTTSGVLSAGEEPNTRRALFTVNGVVNVQMVST